MVASVYDLRAFYECRRGKIIHPILQSKILSIWPDAKGLRMAGCGYAVPFLTPYMAEAERVVSIMPARLGVHHWGHDGKNLTCLAEESELPIETESIDRLLLVHSLEHTEIIGPYLQEIWRVMKSNGRILIVAPNRRGFWSRAEWSPFGHGTPFSASQLISTLRDNMFIVERTERALYMPALRSIVLLRACLPLEQYGRHVMGGMAGVLMVEASKQLYGGVLAQHATKLQVRGRRILIPSTASGN